MLDKKKALTSSDFRVRVLEGHNVVNYAPCFSRATENNIMTQRNLVISRGRCKPTGSFP